MKTNGKTKCNDKEAIREFNAVWLPLMFIRAPRGRKPMTRWMAAYEPFYKAVAGNDLSRPTIMIHKSINTLLAAEVAS